jgi:fluoride exporter
LVTEPIRVRLGGYFSPPAFLGGFTTFSAFSLDTALLWERGQLCSAGFYVLATVTFSVIGMFGGLALIRGMN